MYLEKINSPSDLKKLKEENLPDLAQEIRKVLINVTEKNGGHLASNLGVVELTIALHYVFDTPNDRIIFDVGHQIYTHKLLTNRRETFDSIRQKDGISGFSNVNESEYDPYVSGHASTSLSLACGLARARAVSFENFEIITVIGDGALSGGMVYEAINDSYNVNGKQIVIINDNSMSISKTVGYVPQILNRLDRYSKKGIIPSTNCEYYSGVNGHDFKQLISMFRYAKNCENNIIIHVNTVKGKGYRPAELDPLTYHGLVNQKDIITDDTFSKEAGLALADIAKTDSKIVAVTAAMAKSVGLTRFSQLFPNRVYDVGIAEEHAVTMCSGMTLLGCKPYFLVYSTFLQRGFDQIIHDVCINKLPVTFLVDRAGLVCDDGPTHQGIYDVSFFNFLDGVTVLAPKDTKELRDMIVWSKDYNLPLVIRYPKGNVNVKYPKTEQKDLLSWEYLYKTENNRVVVASGARMVELAYNINNELSDEEKYTVINARCIKPIDKNAIKLLENKNIVVLEDNVKNGGLYSTMLDYVNENGINVRLRSVAVNKVPSIGTVAELQQECGLTKENILINLE